MNARDISLLQYSNLYGLRCVCKSNVSHVIVKSRSVHTSNPHQVFPKLKIHLDFCSICVWLHAVSSSSLSSSSSPSLWAIINNIGRSLFTACSLPHYLCALPIAVRIRLKMTKSNINFTAQVRWKYGQFSTAAIYFKASKIICLLVGNVSVFLQSKNFSIYRT